MSEMLLLKSEFNMPAFSALVNSTLPFTTELITKRFNAGLLWSPRMFSLPCTRQYLITWLTAVTYCCDTICNIHSFKMNAVGIFRKVNVAVKNGFGCRQLLNRGNAQAPR